MKNYELIEHTADIGIKLKNPTLKGIFANTAEAMFDIIAEKKSKIPARPAGGKNQKSLPVRQAGKIKKIIIKQKANNLEELFVNWLNELLSLSATKEKIFCGFRFRRLDKQNLEAEVSGCDIKDYKINTEIKAATYCQLSIAPTKSGWQAQIIFDV